MATRGVVLPPKAFDSAQDTASVVVFFRTRRSRRSVFDKYAGSEVKLDGEEHVIIREDEILCVIEK